MSWCFPLNRNNVTALSLHSDAEIPSLQFRRDRVFPTGFASVFLNCSEAMKLFPLVGHEEGA